MSPNAPFVELRNVTFGYGDRVILRDLSLQVPRGKVTALMGASGGGKTTVLRLIGGQNHAQQGQVLFDGQDVTTMDAQQLYAARRRMGMLFQFGALFTDMSVFDNVAFPLREHTDLPPAVVSDLVLMKLQAVGLRGAAGLRPGELSGGMARRVALARAVALDPMLILYDEPFAGLDPKGRDEIYGQLLQLQAETGMGILLVTHNMEDAARLAQRLLVLDQGQLLLDGSPQQIFQEEGTLLKSCGLEPPGVTKLMGALTQAGLPLKASQAVTPKEAAQEIAAILRKQGGQVHVE